MINDALDEGLLGGPCDIAKQVEGEACGVTAIPCVVVALLFLVSVFFFGLCYCTICWFAVSFILFYFSLSFCSLLSSVLRPVALFDGDDSDDYRG